MPQGGNKDYINALLVVAALITTVTFTSGFTIPGGFKDSTPNVGMANLITNPRLILFLIFDILALETSFLAVVSLILAQLGDPTLYQSSVRVAMISLYFAMYFMTLAFFFVMVIAAGNVRWLVYVIFCLIFSILTLAFSRFMPHLLLHYCGSSYKLMMPFVSFANSCDDDGHESPQFSAHKSEKISNNDQVEMSDTT